MLEKVMEYLKHCRPEVARGCVPVYSVMIGPYDKLMPVKKENGLQYFMFTDQRDKKIPDSWEVVYIDNIVHDAVVLSRAFKMLGHCIFPDSPINVYVDASFLIFKIKSLLSKGRDADISLFRHPYRKSVRSEIQACIDAGKETCEIWDRMGSDLKHYLDTSDEWLFAGGFIARNYANPSLKYAMEEWFIRFISDSRRDQITIPYIISKYCLDVNVIELNIFSNPHLFPRPHTSDGVMMKIKWVMSNIVFRRCGI